MPKLKENARRALVEERKAQILAAAAKVFANKGFERATIADIAKQAGIAEGSIYNYFKNKEDLLISLPQRFLRVALGSAAEQLLRAEGTAPPPEMMLDRLAHTVLAAMRENAHIFRILLSAIPSLKPAARQKYLETVVLYATRILETYFRQGIDRGVFRSDLDPRIAPRLFIGMFFPFILIDEVLQVRESVPFDYDQVIGNAVQLFVRGALAEPQKGKRK